MQMREDIVFTRHNTKMQLNVELLKTNTKKAAAPNNVVVRRYCYVMYMSELCKRFKKMLEKMDLIYSFSIQNLYLKCCVYGPSLRL